MDADLSSLFTWNTKQVFVYVTAEWPSAKTNYTNSAVIWDSIITNPSADHLKNIGPVAMKKLKRSAEGKKTDPSRCVEQLIQERPSLTGCSGLLKLKNQKPKYQITHPSGRIAETKDVTLKLHYNVQPWVGLLTWNMPFELLNWRPMKEGASDKFALPALKTKSADGKGKK